MRRGRGLSLVDRQRSWSCVVIRDPAANFNTKLAVAGKSRPSVYHEILYLPVMEQLKTYDEVRDVQFASNGSQFAVACADAVRIFDLVTKKSLRALQSGGSFRCAFAPDRNILAVAGTKVLSLFNIETSNCEWTARASSDVNCVVFSADGRFLIAGQANGTLTEWGAVDGKLTQLLARLSSQVTALALSPDGVTLAAGCGDGQVQLFCASAGGSWQAVHSFAAHAVGNAVAGLAFARSNATLLATGSADTTAKLWDVCDSQRPRLVHILAGHRAAVLSVAISCDGVRLGTGSADATVRIWDVATGHLQRTLTGHDDKVTAVAFHPRQSDLLVTGSYDETVIRMKC